MVLVRNDEEYLILFCKHVMIEFRECAAIILIRHVNMITCHTFCKCIISTFDPELTIGYINSCSHDSYTH